MTGLHSSMKSHRQSFGPMHSFRARLRKKTPVLLLLCCPHSHLPISLLNQDAPRAGRGAKESTAATRQTIVTGPTQPLAPSDTVTSALLSIISDCELVWAAAFARRAEPRVTDTPREPLSARCAPSIRLDRVWGREQSAGLSGGSAVSQALLHCNSGAVVCTCAAGNTEDLLIQ